MKVNAEAFEREYRKGMRMLLAVLIVVGLGIGWKIVGHVRGGSPLKEVEVRSFAIFLSCGAGVYGIGLITRGVVRKLAKTP